MNVANTAHFNFDKPASHSSKSLLISKGFVSKRKKNNYKNMALGGAIMFAPVMASLVLPDQSGLKFIL